MPRIKLDLPPSFPFTTQLPVRITDINYGNHVGNDAILSMIHEIRVQFLRNLGYDELDFAGASLIMSDVAIEFKAEAYYGDVLKAEAAVGEMSKVAFELYYRLSKDTGENAATVAIAKTGMVCYDYTLKKVVAIPEAARIKLGKG